jgi:hypothetical protein
MKRIRTWLILLLATLLNAGCFQSTIRVVIKADGSGTIAVSQIFDNETLDLMRGNQSREQAVAKWSSEAAVKEAGKAYGNNVGLLMSRPSTKSHGSGYLAIYRFDDINQIRIPVEKSDKAFHFSYKQGVLTAFIPQSATTPTNSNQTIPSSNDRKDALEALVNQLRQNNNPYQLTGRETLAQIGAKLISGLDASVELDLPGNTDTRAARFTDPQKPQRVTLLKVSGKELAGNANALNRLMTPSASADDFLSAPGVQLEPKRELTFKLQ